MIIVNIPSPPSPPTPHSNPTQKLITQHTLPFLYFFALMVQRRNAFRLPPHRFRSSTRLGSARLSSARLDSTSFRYEIRHIEPKHSNLGGLSHSVASGDGLVFYTRIPVWTYEIDIRILLKVQAFTACANLENQHCRRGSKYASTFTRTHSPVDDCDTIIAITAAAATTTTPPRSNISRNCVISRR